MTRAPFSSVMYEQVAPSMSPSTLSSGEIIREAYVPDWYLRTNSYTLTEYIKRVSDGFIKPSSIVVVNIMKILVTRPNALPSNGQWQALLYLYSILLLPLTPFSIAGLALRAIEYKTRFRCKQLVNHNLNDIPIKDKLNFLTYNVAMGPDFLNVRNGMMSSSFRYKAIINKLLDYIDGADGRGVVICQEVWTYQEDLIKALAQKFKYIYYYIGRGADNGGFLTDMDSGLFIATNHPIEFIGYHSFRSRSFLQGFAGRGAVEFKAPFDDHGEKKSLGIFGTHLESCDDHGTAITRKQQLMRILNVAQKNNYGASVIVGDLNVSKYDEAGCEKPFEPALDLMAQQTDDFLANSMSKADYQGPKGSFFNMGLVAAPQGSKGSFSKSTVSTPKFSLSDVATHLTFDRALGYPKGALQGEASICSEVCIVEDDYGNKSAPSDHMAVAASVSFC